MAGKVNPAYARPLQEMTPLEAISRAELVEQVTQHPGWKLIVACIEARREALLAQLLNNADILSLEKYAALTAEVRGLTAPVAAAQTILAYAQERQAEAERE